MSGMGDLGLQGVRYAIADVGGRSSGEVSKLLGTLLDAGAQDVTQVVAEAARYLAGQVEGLRPHDGRMRVSEGTRVLLLPGDGDVSTVLIVLDSEEDARWLGEAFAPAEVNLDEVVARAAL